MTRLPGVAAALLGLLAACDRAPASQEPFVAHREGLTLIYEDQSLPEPQRKEARLQVRVTKVTVKPDGSEWILATHTTLKGQAPVVLVVKDGGLVMLGPDGKPTARLLPEGFPDRTPAWTEHGQRFTVVGRALNPDLPVALPPGADRMGVWVEGRPLDGKGPVVRNYLLPGFGEVESREWRDGKWVVLHRLVSQGLTELPPPPNP